MSDHGPNPIFFNKIIKIGHPEHSLTPHPLRPITSHFCLSPPPPSLQSGRHMCITRYLLFDLKSDSHLQKKCIILYYLM